MPCRQKVVVVLGESKFGHGYTVASKTGRRTMLVGDGRANKTKKMGQSITLIANRKICHGSTPGCEVPISSLLLWQLKTNNLKLRVGVNEKLFHRRLSVT